MAGFPRLIAVGLLILLILSIPGFSAAVYHVRYRVVVSGLQGLGIVSGNQSGYFIDVSLEPHGMSVKACYSLVGASGLSSAGASNLTGCKDLDYVYIVQHMFSGSLSPVSFKAGFAGAAYSLESRFLGTGTYRGVPVYRFRITTGFSIPGIASGSASMTVYVYAGMPIPLYVSAAASTPMNISINIEAVDLDLPSNTPTAHTTIGNYTFLLGGMPGATLSARGAKGDKTITVENTGSSPGYIVVLNNDSGKAVAEAVPPGSSIHLSLDEPLQEPLDLRTTSHNGATSYLIGGVVAAAVAIAAAALIYQLRRKKAASS